MKNTSKAQDPAPVAPIETTQPANPKDEERPLFKVRSSITSGRMIPTYGWPNHNQTLV